ncbi:MAG: SDR family NAD(P)-dependent oxidoreductase [Planctomycetota bacterium]
MESPLDLKGRIALVTGAGQGVGRETVLLFAQQGAGGIVINDLFPERAEAVAKEVEALGTGVRCLPVGCDVTRHDDVKAMMEKADREFDRIDILINNAGVPALDPSALAGQLLVKTQPDDWEPYIRLNLYGVMYCTHVAVKGMVERGYGKIVTVISDAGRVGEVGRVAYSAAKAGAAGFSRALAQEVGRSNVNVNCIALGTTRTPVTEALFTEEVVKRMLKRYPLKRLGEPNDAASALLFLASDAASWITGQTLPVNGGFSLNQ